MSPPRVRVLMYHGIDRVRADQDPYGLFVDPQTFRHQLDHLLGAGYAPIGEEAYLAAWSGAALPRKAVLLTFDDGYAGIGEYAAPVLAELGVPSTLYVPAGLLGAHASWLTQRHPLLSAGEVRELARSGMTIAAHGLDHSDLTRLDEAGLRRHTTEVKTMLEEVVGAPVRTFAHPYGSHDARTRSAVARAGYDAAFAVHDPAGRFAISRVDVNASDTMRTFRLKLRRWYSPVRRGLDHAPALRRRIHHAIGYADRGARSPTGTSEVRR